MPNLVNSSDIAWTETNGDLSANGVSGVFGRIGAIGNDAAFGTDDTTGTSVGATSNSVIPQGLFYVYLSNASLTVEVFVNAAWRALPNGGTDSLLVVSDGTNARVANGSGGALSYFARRVTL